MSVEGRGWVTRVGIDLVNWQQEEPAGLGRRRQPSGGGTSRMSREAQVRICERLGVQLPGPTRRQRISGKLRRKFMSVPGFRRIPGPLSRKRLSNRGTKGGRRRGMTGPRPVPLNPVKWQADARFAYSGLFCLNLRRIRVKLD